MKFWLQSLAPQIQFQIQVKFEFSSNFVWHLGYKQRSCVCIFFNFDHLNIKLQISKLIWSTKFRALLSLSLHSSPSSSKLLSMASYGGELLLDSSSPWSGVSSLSSFSIPLPFIFQEAKESIDEEDPRPTSSNGAYIMWYQEHLHLGDVLLLPLSFCSVNSL